MPYDQKLDPFEVGSGSRSRSRSKSLSSGLPFAKVVMLSPPPARPEAAFIAASAASQIIIAEARNEIDWDSEDENLAAIGSAMITPTSLSLLNSFLDHLLFNILAVAKSTQLSALRPAIADTLKPRLAKEVVSIADEELADYMGGGEDEELQEFRGGQQPRGEFDLIRSWRLTRLRCMVYTRLGDMEEEDEDEYIEREGLNEIGGAHLRFSSHIGNITPAAAIFLTSIIEYLGENALGIAGQAARARLLSIKASSNGEDPGESNVGQKSRLVVEDTDMEKVALNPTLGRLWRTWRKCIKRPALSRTLSRESFFRRGHCPTVASSRKSSLNSVRGPPIEPAAVALPMTENDVTEIEVPGLAHDFDSDVEMREATIAVAKRVRPRSLIISAAGLLTPISSNGDFPSTPPLTDDARHKRPRSLPDPDHPSLVSVGDSDNIGGEPLTPFDEPRALETTYENLKAEIGVAFPSTLDTTQVSELPEPIEPVVSGEELNAVGDIDPQALAADASVEVAAKVFPGDDSDLPGDDPCNENAQVIEGQGTVERPKKHALSAQRLRRKPNRDLSQVESESSLPGNSMNSDVSSQLSADQEYLVQGSVVVDDSPSTPQSSVSSSPRIISSNLPRHERSRPSAVPQVSQLRHPEVSCTPLPPVGEEIDPPESLERSLSNEADRSSRRSRSVGAQPSNSEDSDSSHRTRSSRSKSQNGSRHGQLDLSPGVERAAVQRVPSPLPTPSDLTIPKPRRSGSINSTREKRPLTAGSAASTVSTKLKGLVGRRRGDADIPLPIRLRSSSDSSRRSSDATSDDKSDLDKLIKSDETLRYTLTPRNMREMEAPGSPRWNAALAEPEGPFSLKNVIPPGEGLQRTKSTNSDRMNGLRSHPVSELPTPRPESSYVPSSTPTSPRITHQARDPRPVAESVREFAEFIRSTGPTSSTLVSRTQHHGGLQRRATSASVTSSRRADTPTSISQRPTTKGSETRKTGPRLQARPAVTNEGNQTSDLIDFIREGPPTTGTHRIPRHVAPFRTTMDSDELQSLDTARITKDLVKQDSTVSTQNSSTQANSLYSSNSRSGLLEPANASSASTLSSLKSKAARPTAVTLKAFGGNSDVAPRTFRRVRDPYAIDSDDEDFDDSRSKIPKEEESLIDFLRSVPPPPGNDRPPLPFSINIRPPKSAGRSSSIASSMKSRLKRDPSLDNVPHHKPSFSSLRSRTSNYTNVDSITVASIPSSSMSGSTLTTKSPFESYAVARSGYSEHVSRQRNGGGTSRAHIPSNSGYISHRETETGSLADFFRNTEPPPSEGVRSPSMLSGSSSKDSSGNSFTRFFSRRKKVEG